MISTLRLSLSELNSHEREVASDGRENSKSIGAWGSRQATYEG